MSITWTEALSPNGEFVSQVFNLSTGHTAVFGNVELFSENKDNQYIKYYYRFAKTKEDWTEWFPLIEGQSNLFQGYDATIIYFQYKVVMKSKSLDKSPKHKGVRISFYPYELIWNSGDLKGYPKLWITKKNKKGNIQLINTRNQQVLELKNLNVGEEVFIDTYDEIIKSSMEETHNVYRYDDHNNVWLTLEAGENYLDSKGDFDLDVRYYAPILQD